MCAHNLVRCTECGHVWSGLAPCTHPGVYINDSDSSDSDIECDWNCETDHVCQQQCRHGRTWWSDGESTDYEDSASELEDANCNPPHDPELMANGERTGCDLACEKLHFGGEYCRHALTMCTECAHIWDGNAQCIHPII
jgi:hypothetical protein